jgi:hypothetical protein
MFSAEAGFMCEQTHDASETEKTMKTRKNQMLELAAQRATRRIERDERQTRLGRAVDHEIKAMFAKPGNDEALASMFNGVDRRAAEAAEALARTATSLAQRLTEAAERIREAETANEAHSAASWLRTSEFDDLRRHIAHLEALEPMATKTPAAQRGQ